VDPEDPDNFRRAIRPNHPRALWETLGNPLVNVLDIEAVAAIAHEHGLPLVVDNTVPSPYLCNPFTFGADIVVHSATSTWADMAPPWPACWWNRENSTGARRCRATISGNAGAQPGLSRRQVLRNLRDFGYTMKARMEVNRTFGGALSR